VDARDKRTAVRFAVRYSTSESPLAFIRSIVVIAGLVPAIHVFFARNNTWMRGTSPRMTILWGGCREEAQPILPNRTAA
jgi:hypothetical protein